VRTFLLPIVAGLAALPASAEAAWRPVGGLSPPRAQHTATELSDGRVLIAGGNVSVLRVTPTVAVYDPAYDPPAGRIRTLSARPLSGRRVALRFEPAGPMVARARMRTARGGHSATLLPGGRVLVAGGNGGGTTRLASAEIYDPERDSWKATGSLAAARAFHTATSLGDGRVLVIGGVGADGSPLASAEIYDPRTGAWSEAAPMAVPRANHTATALTGGRVLVAGGDNRRVPGRVPELVPTESAEVYDAASGTWSSPPCPNPVPPPAEPSPCLHVARSLHTATPLPDGTVLVAGGTDANDEPGDAPRRSAEVFDPGRGTWTGSASMGADRGEHAAAALADGRVLVTGGRSKSPSSAELFAPATASWGAVPAMDTARRAHTATALSAPGCRAHCGEVLVIGGRADAFGSVTSSFLRDAQLFRASGSPSTRRGVPPERYVVKQSRTPIRSARDFAQAHSLCRRTCRFAAARRGLLTVTVTRLKPGTTYYYAVQAADGGRRGPTSNVARVKTGR
jgi:hypothetical protein